MNFEKQIKLINEASEDPKHLALVVLEISLQNQPEALRRALQAAAIPRWFDAKILVKILDDDLQPDLSHWFDL